MTLKRNLFGLAIHFSAWIKMGDYYWYGCEVERNPVLAARMYANAAAVRDPHVRLRLLNSTQLCWALY